MRLSPKLFGQVPAYKMKDVFSLQYYIIVDQILFLDKTQLKGKKGH